MKKKKIVLAYSGGLDTTYCAVYLHHELNYEVHALLVNTGGFNEAELGALEERAATLPLASFKIADKTADFYKNSIKFLLFANALKNNTYPLSVSAERTTQAIAVAQYAQSVRAQAIAHGSTGAGNDQVRFDAVFTALCPEMDIITPIRDQKLSREQELEYLLKYGVEYGFEKAQYSVNKGLWGTSIGGKETLRSMGLLPESAYPEPVTKTSPESFEISFVRGEPMALNGVKAEPQVIIQILESIAAPYGLGRDVHVGDTIIGMKGRVAFSAAAALILIKAHHLLEKHVLSKNQLLMKEQFSTWYTHWVHEGQVLDPVMRDIEAFLQQSQSAVSGHVRGTFYPYRFVLEGVDSPNDLMNPEFGSYGEMNTLWSGQDVRGFAKINANQNKMFHLIHAKK